MYLVNFVVGEQGVPGAPLLSVSAGIDAPTGRISGTAEITQAVAPPYGHIAIPQVSGVIREFLAARSRIVTLTGLYAPNPLEPLVATFSATLFIEDDQWTGSGSFSYGGQHVVDVPVRLAAESTNSAPSAAAAGSAS